MSIEEALKGTSLEDVLNAGPGAMPGEGDNAAFESPVGERTLKTRPTDGP